MAVVCAPCSCTTSFSCGLCVRRGSVAYRQCVQIRHVTQRSARHIAQCRSRQTRKDYCGRSKGCTTRSVHHTAVRVRRLDCVCVSVQDRAPAERLPHRPCPHLSHISKMTGTKKHSLTVQTINEHVLAADYAVRGEIVGMAQRIEQELAKGSKEYPFSKVVWCVGRRSQHASLSSSNVGHGQPPVVPPRLNPSLAPPAASRQHYVSAGQRRGPVSFGRQVQAAARQRSKSALIPPSAQVQHRQPPNPRPETHHILQTSHGALRVPSGEAGGLLRRARAADSPCTLRQWHRASNVLA